MIIEDFDDLKRITASYGYILKDKYGQPLGSSVTVRADQVDNFYEEKVIVTDEDKLNELTKRIEELEKLLKKEGE